MKLLKRMKKQAAFACAISMALGMQVTTMASDYSGHWAKDVITEWTGYGVVAGYEDGTFRPNNQMTRAEFAAVLGNVFGLTEVDNSISFSDVKMGAWYEVAINKVVAAGFMSGVGAGNFNPAATITRQEAAAALANAYKLTEKGDKAVQFTDEASIAAWAKEQVEILASHGYINGRADGKFDPRANITRAEVLAMFDNLTSALMNKAGTYTTDQAGNVIVNVQDVVLKDMTIKGNLYLAQGINLGDATLENVSVEGTIFVAGGGVNSIHLKNVKTAKPIQIMAQKAVRLVAEGQKVNVAIAEGQNTILTGIFGEVMAPASASLTLKEAVVDKLSITKSSTGEKTVLTVDAASRIKELVLNVAAEIKGAGKIDKLVANATGIKTEIKPQAVVGQPVEGPASGGAGGGGGGGGSTNDGSGNGGGNNGSTTVDKYINFSDITIQGQSVLDKGMTVKEDEITVDLRALRDTFKDKEIDKAVATVSNLKDGQTVKVAAFDRTLVTRTVKEGKIEYTVKDLTSLLANKKNTIKGLLADYKVEKQAETVAEEYFGKTVDELLQVRSSVNVKNLIDGYDRLVADYQKDDAPQEVKDLMAVLEGKGIDITTNEISYEVTVTAGDMKETGYTITVKF